MTLNFQKYQGTGNDFVMIDNRLGHFDKNDTEHVAFLCDRRFGIGADGLILLEDHPTHDFRMVYYNADGAPSSMCGNGGRCLVAFAKQLGVIENKAVFEAIDGLHHAEIDGDHISLQMQDVTQVALHDNHVFLDTGSPHHVTLRAGLENFDVQTNGAKIRYGAPYHESGTNVNFVEKISDNHFAVRTYERGVEAETFSCGTGVTAVAIAMHRLEMTSSHNVTLKTQGGKLRVTFDKREQTYSNIWLHGPATFVFQGHI